MSGVPPHAMNVALATLTAQGVGTVTSQPQTNPNARGVEVIIDITTITGTTPTLTVTIRGRDPISGKTFTLLASAALAAAATTVLRLYPGLTAAANLVASDVLPPQWDITAAVAGTTPAVTGTISANYLP